ncbi:HAD family hydrolase [Candidatus Woesebacteria bacterium]|nr:HAD family hydrolase [Candidatus Woesebacteria bacterium]
MSITTVFFDTSDTLYHNEELANAHSKQPILQLAEVRNISFDQAKALFKETKAKLKETHDHVTKVAVMMELGVSRMDMQEYIARIDAHDFLQPDERLKIMLESMSKHYTLGIITNVLEKVVLNVLEALAVPSGYFTHFVTVDNTSKSKPDPEPFQKALELAQCSPESCVYVADSLTKDIIPAQNVGMKTVLISHEPVDDTTNVDRVVQTVYETEQAVKRL